MRARIAGLAAAILLCLVSAQGFAMRSGTLVLETVSGPHSFEVEIATTPEERALGLMFRSSLPENSGMLFLYDEPQPVFMWMKDTILPLDMIFIDPAGRVHRIESRTEPFSLKPIPSEGAVLGILEVNAGKAAEIGLKVGDKVLFPGGPNSSP